MKSLVLASIALFFAANVLAQGDLNPGYWEQTPLPQTGIATFYASGMMEYVKGYRTARRQLPDCPECVGTVALLRAGDIGRKVWLQPPGGQRVGPFLVIDCARWEDVGPLLDRNWVVDVSYEVGQFWSMDRPMDDVTVLADPADGKAFRLPGAPTPFVVPPGEVVLSAPTPTSSVATVAPTSWPTSLPVALAAASTIEPPAASPTPAVPPPPTPLTPVVTKPTPTRLPQSLARAGASASPQPTATVLAEIAVGRPGLGLLSATGATSTISAPTPTESSTPTATPTTTPWPKPRVTSAPILPASGPQPLPSPSADQGSPWLRLWRSLTGR